MRARKPIIRYQRFNYLMSKSAIMALMFSIIVAWIFASRFLFGLIGPDKAGVWWVNLLMAADFLFLMFIHVYMMVRHLKLKDPVETPPEKHRNLIQINQLIGAACLLGAAFFFFRAFALLFFGWRPLPGATWIFFP